MASIVPGRYTAEADREIVVFLIGMRINRPLRVRRWLPVFTAMGRMLRVLQSDPAKGLLGVQGYFLPSPILVQYWRSVEDLHRFARSPEEPHLGAWRRFNKTVGASGDVGIWHETYRVRPGDVESMYGNMPVFGLAAATTHVPMRGGMQSAARRMGVSETDDVAVEPYGNPE
jgi:hypothetical protein